MGSVRARRTPWRRRVGGMRSRGGRAPWRRLGAEALLGTPLTFDAEGRVTGAFDGANCRGEEKVRRLKAAYGEDLVLTAAYGDTSGDAEMLAIAQSPGFRVFTQRP